MCVYDKLVKIDKSPNVLLARVECTSEFDSAPSFGLVDISKIIPLIKVYDEVLANAPIESNLHSVTFLTNPVLSFLGYSESCGIFSPLDDGEKKKAIEEFLGGDDTIYALYDDDLHRYSIDPSDFSDNVWQFECLEIDAMSAHIKWYGKFTNDEIYISIDREDLVL